MSCETDLSSYWRVIACYFEMAAQIEQTEGVWGFTVHWKIYRTTGHNVQPTYIIRCVGSRVIMTTSELSVTGLTAALTAVAKLKEQSFVKEWQTQQGQKFNDSVCVKHGEWAVYWHVDKLFRAALNGWSQLFKIRLWVLDWWVILGSEPSIGLIQRVSNKPTRNLVSRGFVFISGLGQIFKNVLDFFFCLFQMEFQMGWVYCIWQITKHSFFNRSVIEK